MPATRTRDYGYMPPSELYRGSKKKRRSRKSKKSKKKKSRSKRR